MTLFLFFNFALATETKLANRRQGWNQENQGEVTLIIHVRHGDV